MIRYALNLILILFWISTAFPKGNSCRRFYANHYTASEQIFRRLPEQLRTKYEHELEPHVADTELNELTKLLALDDKSFMESNAKLTFSESQTLESFAQRSELTDAHFEYLKILEFKPLYDLKTGLIDLNRIKPQTLSLENGRQALRAIRLNYVRDIDGQANAILNDYAQITSRFPNVRFVISTPLDHVTELKTVLEKLPKEFQQRVSISANGPSNGAWNIWAQDHSKPLDGDTLRSLSFKKMNPANETLKTSGNIVFETLPAVLQGGNIVVGDRHIFIGPTEIQTVMHKLRVSATEATRYLEATFGKPVITLQTLTRKWTEYDDFADSSQRSFHLDLDLVIAVDKNTNTEVALVRSPITLMKGLLGLPPETKIETVEDVKSLEKQILKFFQKQASKRPPTQSEADFVATLIEMDPRELLTDELSGQYQARMLKAHGYNVKMIPGFGKIERADRQDFFTSTNVILSGNNAIVPFNNISGLDAIVAHVYRNLGYHVHQMRSSAKTIKCNGAIRCVSETYRVPLQN